MQTFHVYRNRETIPVLSTGVLRTALDYLHVRMKDGILVTHATDENTVAAVSITDLPTPVTLYVRVRND